MKGLAKLLIIITGIVAVIVVAAFIILKTVVTPERVKEAVLPIAQKALHREVTLNDVDISIFKGIGLQGLTIMNREGKEPFVSCEAARLHYDLFSLLKGKVQIHEVTIVSPLIHVIRNKDGSFNFSDLMAAKPTAKMRNSLMTAGVAHAATPEHIESAPVTDKKNPTGKRDEGASDKGIAIAVSNINIDNGKVIFTDNAAPGGKSVETTLSDLNINIKSFSTEAPFPVKLSTRLNSGTITAEGTVNIKGPDALMDVNISGLAITDFSPYFAASVPGRLESALLGTDFKVHYTPEDIKSAGSIKISSIDFAPKEPAEAAIKDAFAELQHEIVFNPRASTLSVKGSTLDLNGIKVKAQGTITGLNTNPVLALDITLPEQDPGQMIKALPQAYQKKAAALSPTGVVSAMVRIEGKADAGPKLLKHATLAMKGLSVKADGIPAGADGKIIVDGDRLRSSGLSLKLGKSVIKTDLKAERLFSKPVKVRTTMTSDEIDLDAILASRPEAKVKNKEKKPAEKAEVAKGAGNNGASRQDGRQKGAGQGAEPLNIPVDAAGTVYIALLKYHNVPVRDVKISYTLKNNKLHVTQTSKLSGGNINKNVDLDLGVRGYRYKGDFNVSNVLVQQLLAYASPSMKNAVSGILDLKGDFSGAGIDMDAIKRNLSLKGNWSLIDGTLAKTGVVSGLVSFLNLGDSIDKIDIKNARGDFKVDKGNVIFKGKFTSDRINLAPEGKVSLDGDMDIHLNAVLSPELAAKLPAGQYIAPMKDSRGWSVLPLMVGGTWSSPSIAIDKKAVANGAAQLLTDKLLGGSSKKEKTTAEENQDQPQKKPEEQLLEHAIKGLFGN